MTSSAVNVPGKTAKQLTLSPSVPSGYQIIGFMRISTNHQGTFTLTSYSTGGANVGVTVFNEYEAEVSAQVFVTCVCAKSSIVG